MLGFLESKQGYQWWHFGGSCAWNFTADMHKICCPAEGWICLYYRLPTHLWHFNLLHCAKSCILLTSHPSHPLPQATNLEQSLNMTTNEVWEPEERSQKEDFASTVFNSPFPTDTINFVWPTKAEQTGHFLIHIAFTCIYLKVYKQLCTHICNYIYIHMCVFTYLHIYKMCRHERIVWWCDGINKPDNYMKT